MTASGLVFLREIPPEFPDFAHEQAEGIAAIHGAAAAEATLASMPPPGAPLDRTGVWCLGLEKGSRITGMAAAVVIGDVAQIDYLHLCAGWREPRYVALLLEGLLRVLGAGPRAIIHESVQYAPLPLEEAFTGHGFTVTERLLMAAPVEQVTAGAAAGVETEAFSGAHTAAAAALLARTYNGPERRFHPHLFAEGTAQALLERHWEETSRLGLHHLTRVAFDADGSARGLHLAQRLFPNTGHLNQLAVAPECRNQGLGATLVQEGAAAMLEAGLETATLGVTPANPARRLYERIGFEDLCPFWTCVCWRNPPDPAAL